jgi:hypothetical protein
MALDTIPGFSVSVERGPYPTNGEGLKTVGTILCLPLCGLWSIKGTMALSTWAVDCHMAFTWVKEFGVVCFLVCVRYYAHHESIIQNNGGFGNEWTW